MKYLFLILLLFNLGCGGDDDSASSNESTLSYQINGEWFYDTPFIVNQDQEVNEPFYNKVNFNGQTSYSFVSGTLSENNVSGGISFNVSENIIEVGVAYSSSYMHATVNGEIFSFDLNGVLPEGTVTFTHIGNNTLSGTFYFTGLRSESNSGETIDVLNGSFTNVRLRQ